MSSACAASDQANRVFHPSMRLYVLAAHRPKPDNPDWVEVSCVRRGGTDHMLAYISPVDACIEQTSSGRSGTRQHIVPFDQLDPRPFIESHEGHLNLCVVYGFAAHGGHLIADPQTGQTPLSLGAWKSFAIAPEAREHFGLDFGDMHEMLGRAFKLAGLPIHADTLERLSEDAPAEIERIAADARQRMKQRMRRESGTQYAVYDPVTRRWHFGAIERIRTRFIS